jgi:hypothetical protein
MVTILALAAALPTLLPDDIAITTRAASSMTCSMSNEDSTLVCYDINLASIHFDTETECDKMTQGVMRCSRYIEPVNDYDLIEQDDRR